MMTKRNKAWRLALGAVAGSVLLSGCGGSSSGSDDPAETQGPVRQTQQGEVEGVQEGNMLSFRGIPYAQPPVGE